MIGFVEDASFVDWLWVAVDIALVAFVTYRVILLLNRTRAFQLLFGVALILVVDAVARLVNLTTLSWIITNISSYLVFGLIVLLQPELRRLISEIGQTRIFRYFSRNPDVPLESIAEAVKIMASGRIGSIIVILKSIRPDTIIERAVRVDGAVSAELLQTIFHKDTPLHDGAVFIEGDRVVAASCYLPLSDSRALKRTHGARHRAGMGISEESDGVVLVTSEETGKISVMYNGELRTPVRPAELVPLVDYLLNDPGATLTEPAAGSTPDKQRVSGGESA
jgi:diadenylate cyclase